MMTEAHGLFSRAEPHPMAGPPRLVRRPSALTVNGRCQRRGSGARYRAMYATLVVPPRKTAEEAKGAS